MKRTTLQGRNLVLLALVVLLAGLLAACGGAPAAAPAEEAAPAAEEAAAGDAAGAEAMADAGSSNEAPELAAMVADGSLPPLEERLPVNPLVVEPEESVGQYGGTWRTGLRGGDDNAWFFRTIGYQPLISWTRDWTDVEPNVAESWEVNEEATEFVFKLREGMKWSDGEPFTADDILFWWNDIVMNEEITPAVPKIWMAGDEPMTVEKIDDYTVKFSFTAPYGAFLLKLASADGMEPTNAPAHWLEQFHADYNENAVTDAEEAGFEDWVTYFQDKWGGGCCGYNDEADRPTLWAWRITTPYGENTTTAVAERNPYFWKVDTAGNQLPYIDKVVYDVGNDVEVLVLKAMNGELDYQDRHIATFNNKAIFFDNQEQGGYVLTNKIAADNNVMDLSLNLTHLDSVKREIFNNKDFRIGLSHAINRPEIIELVYVGQGEPWQVAPLPESPYFVEELGTQYLDYDVALANEYLDKAGYTERDDQGFRLGPDGQRISFLIDVIPTFAPELVDIVELLEGYWAEVGIEMKPNVIDRSLGEQRLQANEHDANVWVAPGGIGYGTLLDPRNWIPMHGHSRWGRAWFYWYTSPDNELAEEPPAIVQQQLEMYEQALATADAEEQAQIMRDILEIAKDNFFVIGISKPAPQYAIANAKLRNIMDNMPSEWQYPTPAPSDTEQWYFEQ